MDLQAMRREYLQGGLRRRDMASNPHEQFAEWMRQAIEMDIIDPTAMVLATAMPDGDISQRIVLLKGFDAEGFVFYSNYDSRKGRAMAANPRVSLHFPWHALERQVIVAGQVDRIPAARSAEYFHSRPRESQLAAIASEQSQPVADRDTLEQAFVRLQQEYADREIPVPEDWGGYIVRPERMEFWQGGRYRLHDRFEYQLQATGGWALQRLSP